MADQLAKAPTFSIIVPHYQGAVSHLTFCRGIQCLLSQSYKDFEVLCYHDGPLLEPNLAFPVPVVPTEVRHNDWGHSLRQLGIQQAKGRYIVHFNPDNILYPFALHKIAKELE